MLNRKLFAKTALLLFLLLAPAFVAHADEKPAFLKSATYVSDAWVINFWNSEMEHMEEEMAQIANDGFNSIILVVPWNEFQPKMQPVQYNDYAFRKLHEVMECAMRHSLWVQLRVSYTWDYHNGVNSALRFRSILGDEATRSAWIDYMGKVYREASTHKNFYGGFITWEDFWNYVEDSTYLGNGEASVEEAKRIGYQDYLKTHCSIEHLNEYYQPANKFTDYDSVYIPEKDSPARKLFYEFYDAKLMGLLADGQEAFPGLSLEVRLDIDPVEGLDGEKVGMEHNATFGCGNADYTSLMYSVSMGKPAYAEISADEALEMMESLLSKVKAYNGGKPIYIDQLLYTDATEYFSYNAKLKEEEIGGYLTSLPSILKTYTNGYGVWCYRNYKNNPLYNWQFALEGRGWETSRTHFVEHNGSRMAQLEAFGKISQKCADRIYSTDTNDNHVSFYAESRYGVNVTVKLGGSQQSLYVDGSGEFDLNFGKLDFDEISISTDGEIYLDNIQIYNFIQDGKLYDVDGSELGCMGAIRTLNAAMAK